MWPKPACMQTHVFLFALMTVKLLPAWWLFSLVRRCEISVRTHGQFTNSSALPRLGFWGDCSASNEFLPSNFSPSCRLGSIHVWRLCNPLSELLSCWTGRPCRQTRGCYSDVRRAFKHCLFAVLLWMIDSGLKMMAWQNHLPSQL